MDDLFLDPEPYAFGCCGCWLLPALAVVLVISLAHTLRMTWWGRGMEPGQRYCAGCRFDLRGGGGMSCPECGCDLSADNIVARDVEPPMPTLMFAAMIAPLITGPIVMVGALFLLVLPVNYDRSVRVELFSPSTALYELTGSADYRRGGDSPYTLQLMVAINEPGGYAGPRHLLLEMNAGDDLSPAMAMPRERFLERLAQLGVAFEDPADVERPYRRAIALAQALRDGGRFAQPLASQLGTDVYSYTEFNPHPLLLIFVILLGLAAWLGVMYLAVRAHRRTLAGYAQNKAWLVSQYAQKVAGRGPANQRRID